MGLDEVLVFIELDLFSDLAIINLSVRFSLEKRAHLQFRKNMSEVTQTAVSKISRSHPLKKLDLERAQGPLTDVFCFAILDLVILREGF